VLEAGKIQAGKIQTCASLHQAATLEIGAPVSHEREV